MLMSATRRGAGLATVLSLFLPGCKQHKANAVASAAPEPSPPAAAPPKGPTPSPSASADGGAGPFRCTHDAAFPKTVDLPEASAAAEVELIPGTRELLIVSDGHGRALAWTLPNGPGRRLKLELDDAGSKDVEGITWHDGKLHTLTSSGAVRTFVPDGKGGLRREGPAYAIEGNNMSCKTLQDSQCGMNYEGLCLRPSPKPDACAGYAVAKERELLVCVRWVEGKIAVDPSRALRIAGVHRKSVSDCAFGAKGPGEGALVITTNRKSGSVTYLVDEATSALTKLEVPGTESNEAVSIDHDGTLWIFADAHEKNSEALRIHCGPWPGRP